MKKNRRIKFYELSFENERSNSDPSKKIGPWLKDNFIQACERTMTLLDERRRAVVLDDQNTIEIISSDKKSVFLKLGRLKEKDIINLRNIKTCEAKEVPMIEDEFLEVFTYCYVDFETCIVAYMGVDGAPRYQLLEKFLNAVKEDDINEIVMTLILPKDAFELLNKKKNIGKCSIKVAVPCDNALSDFLKLPKDDFLGLTNLKYTTIDLTIKAERNKNLFHDRNKLSRLIDNLLSRNDLKLLQFQAKDDMEKSQIFDLLIPSIVKDITVDVLEGEELSPTPYEIEIKKIYQQSKSELVACCKR